MNSTDLMIGDWVYDLSIVEVVELNESGYKLYNDRLNGYTYNVDNKHNTVEPIPLTPEILEKNELTKTPCFSPNTYYYCFDGADTILMEFDGSGYYTQVLNKHKPIKYVHELQHALRLLGLTELADNFKV